MATIRSRAARRLCPRLRGGVHVDVTRRRQRDTCGIDASDVIAAVAVLIALATFVEGRRQAGMSKRALGDESRRREEEIALVRRQMEADTQEREARRRANVFVTWSGQASGSAQAVEYTVTVSNTGPSAATHVALYLVTPEGHVEGAGTSITRALMPGDQVEATMLAPPRDMHDGILAVHVRWADEANPDNDEDSGVRVSPP